MNRITLGQASSSNLSKYIYDEANGTLEEAGEDYLRIYELPSTKLMGDACDVTMDLWENGGYQVHADFHDRKQDRLCFHEKEVMKNELSKYIRDLLNMPKLHFELRESGVYADDYFVICDGW